MNAQTLITPAKTCNFVIAIEEPIIASPRDYGFDFAEEELGNKLLTPLPVGLADQPIPEVSADEFEKVFQYFLS